MKKLMLILSFALSLHGNILFGQEWPTNGWKSSPPANQKVDIAPFDNIDSEIKKGSYGNIDHLLVVKNGYQVFEKKYLIDYKKVSKGANNDLGCGFESCTNPERIHEYNYLHPDFHAK